MDLIEGLDEEMIMNPIGHFSFILYSFFENDGCINAQKLYSIGDV